jgi:hypothetical protein
MDAGIGSESRNSGREGKGGMEFFDMMDKTVKKRNCMDV